MSSVRTDDNKTFINELSRLVGSSHLLTDPAKTARYRKGFRSGQGEALAVVFPGTLLELWRVLSACVAADKIILMQAANTGLTEGSTPNGNDYDRDIVIISTLRLDKLHLLDKGEQVLAFPGTLPSATPEDDIRGVGATLYALLVNRWPLPEGGALSGMLPATQNSAGRRRDARAGDETAPSQFIARRAQRA